MHTIPIPIFNTELRLYTYPEQELFQANTKVDVSEFEGASVGEDMYLSTPERSLIIHESVHFVDWLLEVRLDFKTDSLVNTTEIRAYMIEWVVGEIEKCLIVTER